ncbi:MAG: hypothetical protein Tsb0014_32910 [Pleurocapsa sp.]
MQVKHQLNEIITKRYQITKNLGYGGACLTYEALDLQSTEKVALKVLSLNELNNWKQIELFEREAKILATLSHPAIPKYLDYFVEDSHSDRAFYIVQELASGESLAKLIESGWRTKEEEIVSICEQVLEILAYLHSFIPPVIHRDIKPQNLIRSDDGKIFLVDFGAVQNTYYNTLRSNNTVVGTYGYMAPEQFQGKAFPATDLYGLGTTILFLLTHRSPGELPYNNLKIDFRSQVEISRSFAIWLEKMLEPKVSDRFSSAMEALAALNSRSLMGANRWLRDLWTTKLNIGTVSAIALSSVTALSSLSVLESSDKQSLYFPTDNFDTLCQSGELTKLYLENGGDPNLNIVNSAEESNLLFCFLAQQDFSTVEMLLDRGAEIESKNSQGYTPLLYVLSNSKKHKDNNFANQTIAKLLINRGANVEIRDERGKNPLILALSNGYPEVAKLLVAKGSKANLDYAPDQNSSLLLALSQNYREITKLLILKGANVNITDRQEKTPLFTAVAQSDREIIELLIARGANLNHRDRKGRTVLFEAVARGDRELVAYLLEQGVELNVKDNNNRNALFEAVSHRDRQQIVELLIEKGIDVNTQDIHQNTSLLIALFNKYIELGTIELLLSNEAQVNKVNQNKMTPLLTALSTNYRQNIDEQILKVLLENGADVNTPNLNNHFPLFMAAASEQPKIVELMLNKGAKINYKDRENNNVLLHALNRNYRLNSEIVRQLINAGVDVNAKNDQGLTPLHLLVNKSDRFNRRDDENFQTNIELLIKNGANINVKDSQGRTPLLIAKYHGNSELISLLKSYGAKYEI